MHIDAEIVSLIRYNCSREEEKSGLGTRALFLPRCRKVVETCYDITQA
jgi:hypothetical protein